MLVLSRYNSESIIVGTDVVVTVVDIRGDKVRLGIAAPADVPIHREDVLYRIAQETGVPVPPLVEAHLAKLRRYSQQERSERERWSR